MSADNRTQPLSVDTSTDTRPICWSIRRLTSDRYIGRYVSRHISRVAVYISTEISVVWRSTYRLIYWLICWPRYRPRGAQITQDPRKLGHFLTMLLKVIVDQKGHVGEIQYFWWLLLLFEIAFNNYYFFNAVKIKQILLSDWLSELVRWTYLKHSGFSVFVPQEKVPLLVRI